MKTLLGVLLLLLTALCTCSDTLAGRAKETDASQNYQEEVSIPHCSEPMASPTAVTDIPPVGCAIPMAQQIAQGQ